MTSSDVQAPLAASLRIIVSGAGIGGLATALALARRGFQHIDVYEAASNLGFVGAGIQVAPNLGRVLGRLGAWEHVKKDAVVLREAVVLSGATDEELAHVVFPDIAKIYGYPHCVAHRAALVGGLYESCKAEPSIQFHFSTTIIDVDFDKTRALIKQRDDEGEGSWVQADVILAADGVKSTVRKLMLTRHEEILDVKDTGQASYRVMLTRDQLKHDPELLALLDSNTAWRWIGSRRHVIAYAISQHTIFNISTTQPDENFAAEPSATWTTKGDKQAMLNVWADFCPRVRKLFELVPEGEVCEWKLRVHESLERWVDGNVGLVGDACHPTLPHLSQGAAQAVEDAGVLGVVLSKITRPEDIRRALLVYEKVRKERAMYLVEQAAVAGRALHLTDPEAQKLRDEAFRQVKNGGPNPDKWADRSMQDYIYGHDCVDVAEEKWEEYFAETQ